MSVGFNNKFRNFQSHKVDQFIKVYGEKFTFVRQSLNEFGEPDPEREFALYQLDGVYHEEVPHMYIVETSADASTRRQKPSAMILIRASEAETVHLQDLVLYRDKCLRVIEKSDVAERAFTVNLSLEEVQSDVHEFSS